MSQSSHHSLGGANTFHEVGGPRPQGAFGGGGGSEVRDSLSDNLTFGTEGTGTGPDVASEIEIVDLAPRYRIESVLGRGGMGEVLLATDTRLGRKVAIKRILATMAGSGAALLRFLREAQAIASLNHVHIVQVYDSGRDREGPYVILEYVDGGSLQRRCDAGPIPLDETIAIVSQVSLGLARAHALGIVHRDIKPANILLTSEGIPKLTDFGLARQASETRHTVTGAVMGTPDYMAPEQRRDATQADARSDLWSLAATTYQMVTGRRPNVIRLSDLPGAVRSILSRALEDDPAARFQSVEEFREALLRSRRGAVGISAGAAGEQREIGECAACQTVNEPARKFCRQCAGPLRSKCLGCQVEIPVWEDVCGDCGGRQSLLLTWLSEEATRLFEEAEAREGAGENGVALDILRRIPALSTDPRLEPIRQRAAEDLARIEATVRAEEHRAAELLAEARAHAEAYDDQAAVRALEGIAERMRTEEMRNVLESSRARDEESRTLLRQIKDRVRERELTGLLPLVERARVLRPQRTDLARLQEQLSRRAEAADRRPARTLAEARSLPGASAPSRAMPSPRFDSSDLPERLRDSHNRPRRKESDHGRGRKIGRTFGTFLKVAAPVFLVLLAYTRIAKQFRAEPPSDVIVASDPGRPPDIAASNNGDADDAPPLRAGGIDLLSLIDVRRDAVIGEWRREGGALVSPSPFAPAVIRIPYEAPDEYILEIRARNTTGYAMEVGLANQTCGFDAYLYSQTSSINQEQGLKTTAARWVAQSGESILPLLQRSVVTCDVRLDSLSISENGFEKLHLQSDMRKWARLPHDLMPAGSDPRSLFLSTKGGYSIDAIRLHPVEAGATSAGSPGGATKSPSPPAESTDMPVIKPGNILLGGKGVVVDGVDKGDSANLFDGDANGDSVRATVPVALLVTLPDRFTLQRIRFKLLDGFSVQYELAVSNNGRDFEIVSVRSNSTNRGWQTIEFTPRPVQSVRLTAMSSDAPGRHMYLTELEAYCEPGEGTAAVPNMSPPPPALAKLKTVAPASLGDKGAERLPPADGVWRFYDVYDKGVEPRRAFVVSGDGTLICQGSGGGYCLATDREYSEFTFSIEYQHGKMTAGPFVSVASTLPNPKGRDWTQQIPYGIEVKLAAADVGEIVLPKPDFGAELPLGQLRDLRRIAALRKPAPSSTEWNKLEITCDQHQNVTVKINGTTVNAIAKASTTTGHIVIFPQNVDMRFRNSVLVTADGETPLSFDRIQTTP